MNATPVRSSGLETRPARAWAGLTVVAEARWPDAGEEELTQVPGFVVSSFNPLVADVAERCLRRAYGEPGEARPSVATVVVSGSGDLVSAKHVARTVDSGGRVGPLMFFQSVPNSIVGHVAARWGLGGPVVCLCPVGDPMRDGLAQAALLIEDGDATAALVVLVEQSDVDGADVAAAVLVEQSDVDGADVAAAVLVEQSEVDGADVAAAVLVEEGRER
jgi:hypothetical protein